MSNAISYVRISASAASGLACIALIALWVRSYWWTDSLYGPILLPNGFGITSTSGRFMLGGGDPDEPVTKWEFLGFKFDDPMGGINPEFLPPVFAFDVSDEDWYAHVPHWILALTEGLIAFALARRRSYSLRILLIMTAVIAMALGAIVYYANHAQGGGGGGGAGGGLAYDLHLTAKTRSC